MSESFSDDVSRQRHLQFYKQLTTRQAVIKKGVAFMQHGKLLAEI
jgi:hypothetical protein